MRKPSRDENGVVDEDGNTRDEAYAGGEEQQGHGSGDFVAEEEGVDDNAAGAAGASEHTLIHCQRQQG